MQPKSRYGQGGFQFQMSFDSLQFNGFWTLQIVFPANTCLNRPLPFKEYVVKSSLGGDIQKQ